MKIDGRAPLSVRRDKKATDNASRVVHRLRLVSFPTSSQSERRETAKGTLLKRQREIRVKPRKPTTPPAEKIGFAFYADRPSDSERLDDAARSDSLGSKLLGCLTFPRRLGRCTRDDDDESRNEQVKTNEATTNSKIMKKTP